MKKDRVERKAMFSPIHNGCYILLQRVGQKSGSESDLKIDFSINFDPQTQTP